MNVNAITSLVIKFELERDIYPNEKMYFKLGLDLKIVNNNNQRLYFEMYDYFKELLSVKFVKNNDLISITWDR